VRVRLPLPAKQLAVGAQHACALLQNESLWCWGENSRGALGLGVLPACCDVPDPSRPSEYLVPQRIAALPKIAAVHARDNTTCAITLDRNVLCWGENEAGQLGIPKTALPVATPTRVEGLEHIKQLSLGVPTCALDQSNVTYCWGDGCPLPSHTDTPVRIHWRAPN
jgi:alpha-tubulin suppressor-like RCC1 family protein